MSHGNRRRGGVRPPVPWTAALLGLALLCGPALADEVAGERDAEDGESEAAAETAGPGAGMPTFTVPTLDLPRTALPGTQLEAPEAARRDAPERRAQAPVEFRVINVQHARGHRTARGGCVARGPTLQGFNLPDFPGDVQPFTTCFRLAADRTVIARFDAAILDPDGREVADASGEVSFAASGTTIDYVVEWVSFRARAPGTYELVVRLDRNEVGRFPIEVARR
jgi:hypothetical protein